MTTSFPMSGLATDPGRPTVAAVRQDVRTRLRAAAHELGGLGLARPALDGKLLRPLTAYLTVPRERREELDERFWMGALAVEMVHEASLFHDDILDEAPERRGRPTLAASHGVGPALVLGDHLLTSAYRAAARARSPAFLEVFIDAVERTVAGEMAQERSQGKVLREAEYREIITGKSGELFRAVFALAPSLLGIGSPERVGEVGAHLGRLYQMVDDFLDYCPAVDRGKLPLQDYRQAKWTWPLGLVETPDFRASEEDILARLFRPTGPRDRTPMERGVGRMREETAAILRELESEGMESLRLARILNGWTRQMEEAAQRESLRLGRGPEVLFGPSPREEGRVRTAHVRAELLDQARSLGGPQEWVAYFGHHARSFRFASRFFPTPELLRVAGLYTYCRFTDDLVDEAEDADPAYLDARLDTWRELTREAYRGRQTGVPLLDSVLGEMADLDVPLHYAEELVEGVRMDLRPRTYESMEELRVYSYRVASVVGGWMTELFGVRDPRVLERAFALGHAMQLTNILRDVGEDLRRGRLYLPTELMTRHGVDRELLEAKMREGGAMFPGYRALMEELMARAAADYEEAFRAIVHLPPFARKPVAVAARVYQGIHDEIRSNGYDNLSRRARTSLLRKVTLGGRSLWALHRLPRPEDPGRGALHPHRPGRPTARDLAVPARSGTGPESSLS